MSLTFALSRDDLLRVNATSRKQFTKLSILHVVVGKKAFIRAAQRGTQFPRVETLTDEVAALIKYPPHVSDSAVAALRDPPVVVTGISIFVGARLRFAVIVIFDALSTVATSLIIAVAGVAEMALGRMRHLVVSITYTAVSYQRYVECFRETLCVGVV